MNRRRRSFVVATVLALIGAALVAGAASSTSEAYRPVIGKPVTVPAEAVGGKRFTISFKVIRSDTRAPLRRGAAASQVSVAGSTVGHTTSFKPGTAKVAFVVPATAQGKLVKVKLTVRSEGTSATRSAVFRVRPAPTVSIAATSGVEGNAGTTTLSFPVTLSAPSAQTVTVGYATSDGSATAAGDYTAANGTLTFQPGEKTKTIAVGVVGDLAIEPDESFAVTLSSAVNAKIADASATGTISNDDTAVPITPGPYKGATQEGNYVFFTVLPNRTITGFRINDLPGTCDPGGLSIIGGRDFGNSVFRINDDGSFVADGSWTGSDVDGDAEWTSWSVRITGVFGTQTSATGTILENTELKYKGTHYRCSTGEKKWSVTLQ